MDQVDSWVSGFPKAPDVGKALEKIDKKVPKVKGNEQKPVFVGGGDKKRKAPSSAIAANNSDEGDDDMEDSRTAAVKAIQKKNVSAGNVTKPSKEKINNKAKIVKGEASIGELGEADITPLSRRAAKRARKEASDARVANRELKQQQMQQEKKGANLKAAKTGKAGESGEGGRGGGGAEEVKVTGNSKEGSGETTEETMKKKKKKRSKQKNLIKDKRSMEERPAHLKIGSDNYQGRSMTNATRRKLGIEEVTEEEDRKMSGWVGKGDKVEWELTNTTPE